MMAVAVDNAMFAGMKIYLIQKNRRQQRKPEIRRSRRKTGTLRRSEKKFEKKFERKGDFRRKYDNDPDIVTEDVL